MNDDLKGIEAALLAGLIRWPAALDNVVDELTADDFRFDHHARIFRAIVATWADGRPVDVQTVADELHRRGEIETIGGYAVLGSLLDLEPTGANVAYHAGIIRDRGLTRRLAAIANEIAADATAGHAPAAELVEAAERKVFALAETGVGGGAVPVRDLVVKVFDAIDERATRGTSMSGQPTGLVDLDEKTAGLHDSELIVIAARPSVGKTTLGLQIAGHFAIKRQLPVLFVSLEMSARELTERLLCSVARVNSQRLRKGVPSREDTQRLVDAQPIVEAAPLFIEDTASQRMVKIAATARRVRRRHGLRLVVIDYLQLVEPENRRDSRHEQVGQVSRRLKALAKDLAVPVLALAQLNREAEERPKLSHLRESGSIEADADVVLLLHSPPSSPGTAEVIIGKNRNGPTGEITLAFRKELGVFENHAPGLPAG